MRTKYWSYTTEELVRLCNSTLNDLERNELTDLIRELGLRLREAYARGIYNKGG